MAIRNLLPTSKLGDFVMWLSDRGGYVFHKSHRNAKYECLRIEKYTPQGNNPHLVFYIRDHDGKGRDAKNRSNTTHITVPDEAEDLVREYLASRKSNVVRLHNRRS